MTFGKGLIRFVQKIDLLGAISLRCLTAFFALLVARLSVAVLPGSEFIALGICMSAVSITAALLFPVNRRFWAEYSPVVFMESISAGSVLILISTPPIAFLLLLSLQHDIASMALWSIWATIAAVAYHVSRYSYGSMVMQRAMLAGQLYLVAIPIIELIAIGVMVATGNKTLFMRLALPATAFLFALPLLNVAAHQRHFTTPILENVVRASRSVIISIASRLGMYTVAATLLLQFSALQDRLVFPWICRNGGYEECSNVPNMVLVALICSGLQSVLNLFVDWARPRVFVDGKWQPQALRAIGRAMAGSLVLGAGVATVGWLALKALHILPDSIAYSFWCLLLIRFLLASCITILQLDLWMSKNIARVIPSWIAFVAATPIVLFLGAGRTDMTKALAVAVLPCLGIVIWEGLALRKRTIRVVGAT